ncbi:MAG TPA: hypothetical protein VKJ65_02025 [Phycisphaerae bacterium]|nr:hypothetical protein [Phycisphaerae bacterium]
MNPGIIAAIVGSAVGVLGGVIGTYFSIRNTNGPRERAFMIQASVVNVVFVLTFVGAMCLLPGIYKIYLVPVYIIVLVAGIQLCNKKQQRIRKEESKDNT